MNLYCIKCSIFAKNRFIKIKCKINEKFSIYSRCIDCGFKKSEIINEEKRSYLVKGLI